MNICENAETIAGVRLVVRGVEKHCGRNVELNRNSSRSMCKENARCFHWRRARFQSSAPKTLRLNFDLPAVCVNTNDKTSEPNGIDWKKQQKKTRVTSDIVKVRAVKLGKDIWRIEV